MDQLQSNFSRKVPFNISDSRGQDQQVPPPLDEAYWSALLRQGESAGSGPRQETSSWDELAPTVVPQASRDGENAEDWTLVETTFTEDRSVELSVIGYNRGGLLVDWNTLRGFVPASQLVNFPPVTDSLSRRNELSQRIGRTLLLRIIELDREQNRLILSERAAQVQPGTRASVLDQLHQGDTCKGRVTNLCDFGVFIDLGGVEGLIHISELSWGRVNHPSDILQRGQEIQVYVMDIQRDQARVALSLKRLQPDPWATVEQRYHVGQIVTGVITNVVDFGAFACVEEGLEGLIHVSELAEGHFLHPRNVVQEGQTVQARILNIDGHARRLGLSLRQQHTPTPSSSTSGTANVSGLLS